MADKNCSICGGKGYYCEFSTVETCWCVEPATKADEVSELRAEVDKLKRLIAERWKPEVERLNDELSACTEHPGGCGYWRDAAKYRAKERDVFAQELESFKQANRNLSESNVRRREDNARLKTENEALRQFAAEAYQVLGALDAPENVLDNASDAASGVPPRHETLLPFFAEGYEALRKDAERYRWLKENCDIDYRGNTPHELYESTDAAIDAALEGGGR